MSTKARYWQALMYPENMIEDWQDKIASLFQVPCVYCVHDKDLDKNNAKRKSHVHIIVAYQGPTTEKCALKLFKLLEKENSIAIPNNKIQVVNNVRCAYDYLIHNTEDSKNKGKYMYDAKERICHNGFDIGNFEQIGVKEKNDMTMELCNLIIDKMYINFADFYMDVVTNFDSSYFEIIKSSSGLLERLTKANFQKYYRSKED